MISFIRRGNVQSQESKWESSKKFPVIIKRKLHSVLIKGVTTVLCELIQAFFCDKYNLISPIKSMFAFGDLELDIELNTPIQISVKLLERLENKTFFFSLTLSDLPNQYQQIKIDFYSISLLPLIDKVKETLKLPAF